jgi:hypothetical protein
MGPPKIIISGPNTPHGGGKPDLLVGWLFVDHIRAMLAEIEGDDPTLRMEQVQ